MAHLCSLFNINHSPRTPYSPWIIRLVKVQNRNLGTHLRIFLPNPPTNWSFQMYAYTNNTTPLSQLVNLRALALALLNIRIFLILLL